MEINRRFKDTLFRKVFNNKKDLLSLYNALKDGRSDKLVKLTDKKELERLYKEYNMQQNINIWVWLQAYYPDYTEVGITGLLFTNAYTIMINLQTIQTIQCNTQE